MDSAVIYRYFPDLSERQHEQFDALGALYHDHNARVNVISRKDINNLYTRHVLHSLAIAKFLGTLVDGTTMLDLGTGGGFPGIPLAIMYPQCRFHLIDRIGKKVRVAEQVAQSIGLTNVTVQHGDSGECHDRYDYVVSRAVTSLDKLLPLVRRSINPTSRNTYPNGLVCLKGGDLDDELVAAKRAVYDEPISVWFDDEYFVTKSLIYVPLAQPRK